MTLIVHKWSTIASLSKNSRLLHCCSAFHNVKSSVDNPTRQPVRHRSFLTHTGIEKTVLGCRFGCYLPSINTSRYKSDAVVPPPPDVTPTNTTNYIPEPPSVDVSNTAVEQLNALGEPTLSSLGLCSSWPPGWVQSLLEYIHVTAELPWWATIASFAVALRLAIIPLQVYALRVSVKSQNVMPKYMELQTQLDEATTRKDIASAQVLSLKVEKYKRENDVRLWRNGIGLMYQIPIFVSVMNGLRKMAYLPVPSMTTGGVYWFTDLTVADPYFLLPLMTAVTLLITVEIGADGLRTKEMPKNRKNMVRGFILIGTPTFMLFNPAALGVYWFTSNIMAVTTNYMIKIPAVKRRLGIPDAIDHSKTASPFARPDTENLYQRSKRTLREGRLRQTADNRESITSKAFDDASRAKIVKTYRHDPTKTKSLP